jgi:hypothetical protein
MRNEQLPKEKSTGGGEDAKPWLLAEGTAKSSITGGCDIGGDSPPRPLTGYMITANVFSRNWQKPDLA